MNETLDNHLSLKTLVDWLDWLAKAPEGTRLEARVVHRLLSETLKSGQEPQSAEPSGNVGPPVPSSWRERLWTVPAETRIGVLELSEALDRSRSWIYHHTGSSAGSARLPVRKMDSELVFTAGEIRTWLRDREEVLHGLPMESRPWDTNLEVAAKLVS